MTRLDGGNSTAFRVDRNDADPVVLKIYDDLHQAESANETYASGLLADTGIPVTRFLAFDQSRSRLPFRFAVTNYLPGVSVDALKGEPDVADLYRQMGQMLRRLHAVRMPGYGRFGATGMPDPVATNAEFLGRHAAVIFRNFRHQGGDDALATRLEAIVADCLPGLSCSNGAVFAHDDFQPHNVLAERTADGRVRLTGLVDFGNARAADAVFDLAKALFCSEHDAPGSTPHILEGYGRIDHPDPTGAIWLYTLMHRTTMWFWLRHVGVIPDSGKHHLIVDLEAMAEEKRL